MATNTSSDSTNEGTGETSESQDQQQESTGETSGQDEQQGQQSQEESTSSKSDDKKDPAKQALLADLNKERKDLKAARTELAALKTEADSLRPKAETVDAIQAKYDRLEGFLQAVGGPLGKALDSRTFTQALFETDKDIAELVKDWNKANPTATSSALGSAAAAPADGKKDVNALLRAALK